MTATVKSNSGEVGKPDVYTITYNTNGGTIQGTPASSYTVEELPVELPTVSKTGYTFIGWTSNNANVIVENGTIATSSYGNVTLNANFEIIEYTITYVDELPAVG